MKIISGYILIFFLASCSANYHLRKAIKKGYKCEEVGDTIRITTIDSFPVIRDNEIVYERFYTTKDTIIQYRTSYVPKTRYQTRIEYRLKRDTIRQVQKVEVAKYKSQKEKPVFWVLILGFVMGMGTMYLFRYSKTQL
jgi:succinate dehydrogenase/fumarate reductase-like Fe-S protein